MEWMLALIIEGSKVPDLRAGPYETKEQCFMAGDLMKAADIAAKGQERRYTISCVEQEKGNPQGR